MAAPRFTTTGTVPQILENDNKKITSIEFFQYAETFNRENITKDTVTSFTKEMCEYLSGSLADFLEDVNANGNLDGINDIEQFSDHLCEFCGDVWFELDEMLVSYLQENVGSEYWPKLIKDVPQIFRAEISLISEIGKICASVLEKYYQWLQQNQQDGSKEFETLVVEIFESGPSVPTYRFSIVVSAIARAYAEHYDADSFDYDLDEYLSSDDDQMSVENFFIVPEFDYSFRQAENIHDFILSSKGLDRIYFELETEDGSRFTDFRMLHLFEKHGYPDIPNSYQNILESAYLCFQRLSKDLAYNKEFLVFEELLQGRNVSTYYTTALERIHTATRFLYWERHIEQIYDEFLSEFFAKLGNLIGMDPTPNILFVLCKVLFNFEIEQGSDKQNLVNDHRRVIQLLRKKFIDFGKIYLNDADYFDFCLILGCWTDDYDYVSSLFPPTHEICDLKVKACYRVYLYCKQHNEILSPKCENPLELFLRLVKWSKEGVYSASISRFGSCDAYSRFKTSWDRIAHYVVFGLEDLELTTQIANLEMGRHDRLTTQIKFWCARIVKCNVDYYERDLEEMVNYFIIIVGVEVNSESFYSRVYSLKSRIEISTVVKIYNLLIKTPFFDKFLKALVNILHLKKYFDFDGWKEIHRMILAVICDGTHMFERFCSNITNEFPVCGLRRIYNAIYEYTDCQETINVLSDIVMHYAHQSDKIFEFLSSYEEIEARPDANFLASFLRYNPPLTVNSMEVILVRVFNLTISDMDFIIRRCERLVQKDDVLLVCNDHEFMDEETRRDKIMNVLKCTNMVWGENRFSAWGKALTHFVEK